LDQANGLKPLARL